MDSFLELKLDFCLLWSRGLESGGSFYTLALCDITEGQSHLPVLSVKFGRAIRLEVYNSEFYQ